MAENEDQWRVLYQKLPLDLHLRWKAQLKRIARANGIADEYFDGDSKFAEVAGPKVATWECLIVLCERTESDDVFRV